MASTLLLKRLRKMASTTPIGQRVRTLENPRQHLNDQDEETIAQVLGSKIATPGRKEMSKIIPNWDEAKLLSIPREHRRGPEQET